MGNKNATAAAPMTPARLADLCAMIDKHDAAGTMSNRKVASICAMIDDGSSVDEPQENPGRRWGHAHGGSTECYRKVCTLGDGTFGVVVKAKHRATGKIVAIKTLLPEDGNPCANAGELLREACFLAACCGHPNLVGLHGIVRDPSTKEYSIVMDYVGPDLGHVLYEHIDRSGRPFREAYVRRVMEQLLRGAMAMHERQIIHGDIKPWNILVSEDGRTVKFCDYGVAVTTAEAAPPYVHVGTDGYMPPEVLLEKPVCGVAIDMWSLGCVMAELLSGRVLFDDDEEKGSHFYKIFDVLGFPWRKECKALGSKPLVKEMRQWRRWRRRAECRDRLRELFPEEVLSRDGFDVLKGLLTFNPDKRLTAAAALRSRWFTEAEAVADDAPKSEWCVTALLSTMALPLVWVVLCAWLLFRRMASSLLHFSSIKHCASD